MIGWQNGDLYRPVSFMIYCKTSSSAQWTQSVWKYSQNPTISLPFYQWPAFMPSWPWPWPCPGARGEGSADCLGDALRQDWLHHLFVQVTFCLIRSNFCFFLHFYGVTLATMNWHWPFVFIGFTNNIHEYDNVDHELIILIISIILPNLSYWLLSWLSSSVLPTWRRAGS